LADLAELAKGLPATIPIFWQDSYKTTGESKILRTAADEKKHYYIVLDETIFCPKGGGQPSDKGAISASGFKLQSKKVMQSGGVIVHWGKLLEGAALRNDANFTANCEIDWDWRFLMMRRHSSAHLLDHCLAKAMGRDVDASNSWLGEPCYVAYHGHPPDQAELKSAEKIENQIISEGRTIRTEQVSMEEVKNRFQNEPGILQGMPKLEKIRLVTIDGCRPIACGGTHLRNVHEARGLRVDRVESHGDEFRVYFDVL
jgi:Ser-tRNA(Ala) deacylase AlaX